MDAQQQAAAWAAHVLREGQAVILDTETTGLDIWAEVCQVALTDLSGAVLLNTLVKPTRPIPESAQAIHGITDAMVEAAPTFPEVWTALQPLLYQKPVLIYNADFDTRILTQSALLAEMPRGLLFAGTGLLLGGALSFECVMHQYSTFVGEWSDYHGNYRWQRLPGGDHSALGDCRATLAVLKEMAEAHQEDERKADLTWLIETLERSTAVQADQERCEALRARYGIVGESGTLRAIRAAQELLRGGKQ